jgi:uncharacterized protein (TIGR04255 family)
MMIEGEAMYAAREVFRNSPLQYVVLEIKYPYAPRLRQNSTRDAILIDLDDVLPIVTQQQHVTMSGTVGGPVNQQVEQVPHAFNAARTTRLAITASALTLDTTDYTNFEEFRKLANHCLEALSKHASPAAIERVGLRYVNEIRVPDPVKDARDWSGWVADALVAAASIDSGHQTMGLQGVVQYATGEHRSLALRFGAALDGSLMGDGPLKRREYTQSGPFFALDFDSFWEPPVDVSPSWDLESLMTVIDELHVPVGATFQAVITDKLRDSVLRRDPDA